MISVLTGHRGVGKSFLGKRIQLYFPSATVIDLDDEIASSACQVISEIFQTKGENMFRQLELATFQETLQKYQNAEEKIFVIVGGGFPVDKIPDHVEVWFVQRSSDQSGRIFLDRPRLNPQITPLDEYFERAVPRQQKFLDRHDFYYQIPEGLLEYFLEMNPPAAAVSRSTLCEIEKDILSKTFRTKFGYTLQASDLQRTLRRQTLFNLLKNDQLGFLEVRDDLLSLDEMRSVLSEMPRQKILYSMRTEDSILYLEHLSSEVPFWGVDCEVKYLTEAICNLNIQAKHKLVSTHRPEIPQLKLPDGWLGKWSPLCNSWTDVAKAMMWTTANANWIFLPRSEDGRWNWLRLFLSERQPVNFLKLSQSSAPDQPTLFECLLQERFRDVRQIACVMGHPVQQSFSPVFHAEFFLKQNTPYYRLAISQEEWDAANCFLSDFAIQIPLRYASVTAPLKISVAKSSQNLSQFKSCNTLFKRSTQEKWTGENTDAAGFFEAFKEHLHGNILMWGGGGMVEVVRSVCLQNGVESFLHLSSRKPDDEIVDFEKEYVLVWAAPSSPLTQYPNKEIRISKILDLNYFDSSFGRNLALAKKIKYVSGYRMFFFQAQQQQKIWSCS